MKKIIVVVLALLLVFSVAYAGEKRVDKTLIDGVEYKSTTSGVASASNGFSVLDATKSFLTVQTTVGSATDTLVINLQHGFPVADSLSWATISGGASFMTVIGDTVFTKQIPDSVLTASNGFIAPSFTVSAITDSMTVYLNNRSIKN